MSRGRWHAIAIEIIFSARRTGDELWIVKAHPTRKCISLRKEVDCTQVFLVEWGYNIVTARQGIVAMFKLAVPFRVERLLLLHSTGLDLLGILLGTDFLIFRKRVQRQLMFGIFG